MPSILVQVDKTTTRQVSSAAVDVVQFLQQVGLVEVFNLDPVATIYFRLDNIDPVPEGDGARVVPPGRSVTFGAQDPYNTEVRVATASATPVRYVIETQ